VIGLFLLDVSTHKEQMTMIDHVTKGVSCLNREGSLAGVLTGGTRHCSLSGCRGVRIYVRWPDGKLTLPCSEGMEYDEENKTWNIL